MKFCSSWKIESEKLISVGNPIFGFLFKWWSINKAGYCIYCLWKLIFGQMYFFGGVFFCKDSCSENCVLINFVFISETLLQNFALNNGLCMWSPALYEQIHAFFCKGVQYCNPASSVKAFEFCLPSIRIF